ncbi:MAG: MotA/TolQ/ExbB proton channel family protein [Planctomycetota bacterium]|nr:MAG: MotA/TolQ/ExbB proton channel family protein [Planctomycetota bacterium]
MILPLAALLSFGGLAQWAVSQDDADAELANELGGAAPAQPDGAAAGDDAAAAPAGAGGGDAGGEQDTGPKAPSNLLAWTFQSLGIGYTVIFFGLSISLFTLIVMNLLAARQDNICPPDLVEGVEQQLAEGNRQGAVELLQTDDSFLGQVVAAGLTKLDRGLPAAIEAMQEVGEEETMKMEHNLSYMALIGNISPMVGLLGTVQGMISAFRHIATSGSTPKPGELAMDISTALFTTLAGLVIAIPAISVYNILRNRLQRLTLQVGVTSEALLERFLG